MRRHRRIAGRPAAAAHFDEVDDGRTRGIPRGVRVNLCATRIGNATWQGRVAVPKATDSPRGRVSQCHSHRI